MDCVVLVSGDFVRTGGMDMPNFALAEHFAGCGTRVEIVAHRIADSLSKQAEVHFHRVPKPFNSYLLGSPLLDVAGRIAGKRALSRGGRVVVNGGNCQIGDVNWVHYVHAAYTPKMSGSIARRGKTTLAHKLNLLQERHALRMAQQVLVNSDRTRRDLVEKVGVDEKRIRTVYYGIDASLFVPATAIRREELRRQFGWPDRLQVAFVGALGDRRKGFDTLFGAWQRLCQDSAWDCDLIVIGRGSELPAWQARVDSAGMHDRIRFLGFRSDVPELLSACDALVAPTRYEAYGLGVQEALCTGLPAIVSANAGVAERYPPELAELLLQDPESVSELEASIRNWRRHSERLRREVGTLSVRLRQKTWPMMAQEIRDLLRANV